MNRLYSSLQACTTYAEKNTSLHKLRITVVGFSWLDEAPVLRKVYEYKYFLFFLVFMQTGVVVTFGLEF
jgi:hypothetical protein